jgi:hypothetical protein
MMTIRSKIRSGYFEVLLHARRWRAQNRRPCVVVFPSNQPWDAASNLRAWLVAPELERLGWRVIVVPQALTLAQRHRILRLERPDVILIQQTRNPLNEPRLYPAYPCVVDADDADYLDPRQHDRIVRAATDAAAVIGGSRFVTECLGRHNASAHVLWTCTPAPESPPLTPPGQRGQIVSWAHASPLGYKHEAQFMQNVMTEVCAQTPCEFWLFGTNEADAVGWFRPIRQAGGSCVALPPMSYTDYLAKVAESAVGLQPISLESEFSKGKSFGKLLAYLSGEVAVVAANTVDHPLFFRNGQNGFLADENVFDWANAIVRLLEDKELRTRVAAAGRADLSSRLTTAVFARLLDPILRAAAVKGSQEPRLFLGDAVRR